MGNLLSILSPLTPFLLGAIWRILVPLVLFSLIKNLFIYPYFLSPLKDLPGPSAGIPLFGQSLKLFLTNNGPNQTLLDWSRKWPKADFIRYLSIGNSEVLLINSLQAHKEIMSTHVYSLVKPAFFRRLVGEITGVGLLFADGEEHKKQRRLLANPFSARNIQKLVPVFKEKAQDLVGIFKAKIDGTGEKSAVLELSDIFSKATLDIIGLTALGIELDNLSAASDPSARTRPTYSFHDAYHTIFNPSPLGAVITLVNMSIPLRSWLPLKANTTYVNANADLRRMCTEIIQDRRKKVQGPRSKDVDGRDLLTFMLEERSDSWTDEEILGHLLNFMSAGHETTAGTLGWACYAMSCLSNSAEIQAKVRASCQSLGDDFSVSEIESLTYLDNFLKEVLRLYNPAFQAPREAGADVTICGTFIPKGTTFNLNPHIMNKHPDIWGPTALEFRPERWAEMKEGDVQRDAYAVQSFINGPRVCIGKNFALLELKVLMVALMREFKFESIGEKVEAESTLTFHPKGGLRLRVSRLSDESVELRAD